MHIYSRPQCGLLLLCQAPLDVITVARVHVCVEVDLAVICWPVLLPHSSRTSVPPPLWPTFASLAAAHIMPKQRLGVIHKAPRGWTTWMDAIQRMLVADASIVQGQPCHTNATTAPREYWRPHLSCSCCDTPCQSVREKASACCSVNVSSALTSFNAARLASRCGLRVSADCPLFTRRWKSAVMCDWR